MIPLGPVSGIRMLAMIIRTGMRAKIVKLGIYVPRESVVIPTKSGPPRLDKFPTKSPAESITAICVADLSGSSVATLNIIGKNTHMEIPRPIIAA